VRGFFGLWSGEEKRTVMAALQRVGLAEQAGQRADSVSGGQQQRAAIARALVQRAQLVFADEPVASLDPVSARKVMDLLSDLNKREGLGVFVSLHQVDYALRYCRRIVALKEGRIAYDGPPEGLNREALVAIYGPEIEDVFWEGDPK
jgi:phosphonate transport system ATP-binding protein